MANGADVRSLEALEELLRRLAPFKDHLGKQLDDTRQELHRISRWLEAEAPQYWHEQEKLAERRCKEARLVLSQCESYVRVEEKRNCTEQKKLFDRASERLGFCKKRVSQIKKLQVEWQATFLSVHQKLQHVVDLVEAQLPLARIHLDRLLEPLRQYSRLTTPTTISNRNDSDSSLTEFQEPSDAGST